MKPQIPQINNIIETGFEIIIKEVYDKNNPNIRGWKAQDSGGRTSIKPTAEEAVLGVRNMFWSEKHA